jgi:hypothetical protein
VPFWTSFARPDSVKPGCCVRCEMRGQRIRTFWPQRCTLERVRKKRKGDEDGEKKPHGRVQAFMRIQTFQATALNGRGFR